MYSVSRLQKMVYYPLKLQLIVSCRVGSKNQTWFLWKSSKCFSLLSHFSSQKCLRAISISLSGSLYRSFKPLYISCP